MSTVPAELAIVRDVAELKSADTIVPAVIPAVIVIFAPPLKDVAVPVTSPLIAIVLAVARVVAVDAFPLNAAVIVPAVKLPLPSLATIALAVFKFVAVVAELLTLSAVAIVANFVSTIPAEALISASTIAPAEILELIVIFAPPLKDVAVPVTSPLIAIVLAVSKVVAVVALPDNAAVIVPALKFPEAFLVTIALAVFALSAVVAVFGIFDRVLLEPLIVLLVSVAVFASVTSVPVTAGRVIVFDPAIEVARTLIAPDALPVKDAPEEPIIGAVNVLLVMVCEAVSVTKLSPDNAALNSAALPVRVLFVRFIDLFVKVWVLLRVTTTDESIAKVRLAPSGFDELVIIIPDPAKALSI